MKKFYVFLIAIFTINIANAQWQPTGPYGGIVNVLAVSGPDIYAGTEGLGIFRSTNNGLSWTAVNAGLTDLYIRAIVIKGSNIFAGTSGGVFRSTNNGAGWNLVYVGMQSIPIYSLVVKGVDIFAGTESGVFRSSTNGTNWVAMNTGLNTQIYSLAVSGNNIFAGTQNGGVYISTDNGINWTSINTGLPNSKINSLAVSGANIFAGSANGIYKSTNNGVSWSSAFYANTNISSICIIGNIIFASGAGIIRSGDNGVNWTSVNNGLPSTIINAIAGDSVNIYAATNKGVFRSVNNGLNWTEVNTGISCIWIWSLAASGMNLFAGTNQEGLFRSTDNGTNWIAVNNGLYSTDIYSLGICGPTIFAHGVGQSLFLSFNNGLSWASSNLNIKSIDVCGSTIFISTSNGVYSSTDCGGNWTFVNGLPLYTMITSIGINGTTIFVGTLDNGMFRSIDNGNSWAVSNTGLPKYIEILSIAVSGSKIFAGGDFGGMFPTGSGLFVSTDNGTTWIKTSLPDIAVTSIAISGTNIFVSDYYRNIFLSSDNGTSWNSVGTGLCFGYINSLVVSGNYLYAGTYGSVWKRPLSEMVGIEENTVNNNISVYPNPASDKITIYLQNINDLQNTTVSVFDIQGQLLLQQNVKQAKTEININSFAKGMYVAKICNNTNIVFQKFIKE